MAFTNSNWDTFTGGTDGGVGYITCNAYTLSGNTITTKNTFATSGSGALFY